MNMESIPAWTVTTKAQPKPQLVTPWSTSREKSCEKDKSLERDHTGPDQSSVSDTAEDKYDTRMRRMRNIKRVTDVEN